MASSGQDIYLQMQKIASDTQVKLQQMTDASTAKSFDYNTREAQKSRNFQLNMSNTSHQREVKDLIKAGLNPVLSANQGANAYNTSSASAQADNAANAVASVTSSRLSGMAGIESSNIGARATTKAASTNAAAMRAAAAQSAAAARYAADAQRYAAGLSYQAQIYKADKDYQARQDQFAHEKWMRFHENPKTITEAVLGTLNQAGVKDEVANIIKNQIKGFKDGFQMFNSLFTNGVDATKNNFKLTPLGQKIVKSDMVMLKLDPNSPFLKTLIVKSWFFNDKNAKEIIARYIKNANRENNYTMHIYRKELY